VSTPAGSSNRPPGDRRPENRPSGVRTAGHDDKPETAGERRLINILIVGFVLFVLGAGLWLGDALLESRRMDECISSGRRNCAPIVVPVPPPDR
jgi:hypothetical protein